MAFRNAATVSITYSLLSRCGLELEEYFEPEDFLRVFDWNTPAAVVELGTAVSTINQKVLRQIEITIKQYEREKSAERTEQHEKQPDLYTQRGLPDPQPKLSETPEAILGKYGRMRKKYLQENRPGLYSRLLESEQAARNRLEQMLLALAQEADATGSLKPSDPMKWVGLMNTCKAQAEEIILSELIYS